MTPQQAIEQMTDDNPYDKAIACAAVELLRRHRSHYDPSYDTYIYYTHYYSGTTIWRSPDNNRSVLVTINGEIHDSLPHHP